MQGIGCSGVVVEFLVTWGYNPGVGEGGDPHHTSEPVSSGCLLNSAAVWADWHPHTTLCLLLYLPHLIIASVAEGFTLVNMFICTAALWSREELLSPFHREGLNQHKAKHPPQCLRESAAEPGPLKSEGHNLIFQEWQNTGCRTKISCVNKCQHLLAGIHRLWPSISSSIHIFLCYFKYFIVELPCLV